MKSRAKFLQALSVVTLATVVPAAWAAPSPAPPEPPGDGLAWAQPPSGSGGPRGMHDRRDRGRDVVEFLGLSDEQSTQWAAAHKAHFEAVRPTFEKIRDLREQMHAELEGASPDAATVGGYLISIHQLDGDLEASRDELETTLREILTDEQETKLDAWKAANHGPRRDVGPGPGWSERHGRSGRREGDGADD